MSEEQKRYSLTLKGIICNSLRDYDIDNDAAAQKVVDNLELYLRRHYSKGGHPAVVFDLDENQFDFVTINKQ